MKRFIAGDEPRDGNIYWNISCYEKIYKEALEA
jgi:hypothetical protein